MSRYRLGVSISKTVYELARQGALDADYIVYYGPLGEQYVHDLISLKPLYLHDMPGHFWLNYDDPFTVEVLEVGTALLNIMQPPWFSTGIGASAEPQAHRDGPYREADPDALQSRETVIENIIRHTARLRTWVDMPVLLENFNYHPTLAYEYICEPGLITDILEETGCGLLLDLAHARISAHNMHWPNLETYLNALPLAKAREIHFTRPGWQGDQRVDLHGAVEQDDLELLGWVLERTPTEAVTLEVDELPVEVLRAQLALMRGFTMSDQR